MKIQQAPATLPQLRPLPKAEPASATTPVDKVEHPSQPPAPPPNTREVRITRFVKGLTRETLEHLRYLSTIWAFNMVGTTVGLVGATPLGVHLAKDNPAVVGGVAIGGGVLTGGVAALIGYGLEKKRGGINLEEKARGSKLTDAALTVASGLQSLPKFIYPTVVGATPEQQRLIYDTLDQLPLKEVVTTSTMEVIPNLTDTGISGMAQPGLTHNRILLDQGYLDSAQRGPELVRHELGHTVDYSGGYGLIGSLNWRGPFGKAPFVSGYAESNRYEDFAESYEHYTQDPDKFRAEFPDKARVIEQNRINSPVEELVDRPSVRQAGRTAGEFLGKVPYMRTALETGLALLSPIQLHRGALALEKGYVKGDEALKLQGKMNLISGIMLGIPGGAPLATVASAINLGMQVAVGDDPEKIKEANRNADRFVAVATGPFGMAATAIGQELKKAGVDLSQAQYLPNEYDQGVSGGAMLKGLLFTVGGAVAGSLIGVGVGSALGGAGAVATGSLWGRIGGGMAGLGLYGYQRAKQPEPNPSPYDLTRGDKVFLAKIVGGAVAGAAAGTVAGSMGGRALATLLVPQAPWLATAGGWAGALIGSYALGKAGAVLGRKLTEDTPQNKG